MTSKYYLRLEDTDQILCRLENFDCPQWWPYDEGRIGFDSVEDARDFWQDTRRRFPVEAREVWACQIMPPIKEEIVSLKMVDEFGEPASGTTPPTGGRNPDRIEQT